MSMLYNYQTSVQTVRDQENKEKHLKSSMTSNNSPLSMRDGGQSDFRFGIQESLDQQNESLLLMEQRIKSEEDDVFSDDDEDDDQSLGTMYTTTSDEQEEDHSHLIITPDLCDLGLPSSSSRTAPVGRSRSISFDESDTTPSSSSKSSPMTSLASSNVLTKRALSIVSNLKAAVKSYSANTSMGSLSVNKRIASEEEAEELKLEEEERKKKMSWRESMGVRKTSKKSHLGDFFVDLPKYDFNYRVLLLGNSGKCLIARVDMTHSNH
jgi:hypothetical protein